MSEERRFTREEADAMLPDLVPRLERLREARDVVIRSGERVRAGAVKNGGGREGSAYWESLRVLRAETEWLAREGIVLRDAENGLIDFPAERDGRPVFLCWKLGEDRVGWWHPPETGFSGRQPI
ncbi:MAG: DUF2203 domain-containing protein [Actinobacteria bacterium]|nr:DUF2203 domain-containing protein [Actinomycetota bacterium]